MEKRKNKSSLNNWKFDFLAMIGDRKMENNKAICRKTDEHFTEGKRV